MGATRLPQPPAAQRRYLPKRTPLRDEMALLARELFLRRRRPLNAVVLADLRAAMRFELSEQPARFA